MNQPLGRRAPADFRHVERFPLSALRADEQPFGVPSVVGVNWYAAFDSPVRGSDRRWRVGVGDLGRVRGGHCVCVPSAAQDDTVRWWRFYDQGSEGACVGFGASRAMSLLNRKRYDAPWLYREAQRIDEWGDTPPQEGTSVRAGLEVLRTLGHRVVLRNRVSPVTAQEGISAYRWSTSVEEWLSLLGWPNASEVPFLNSWGADGYPHLTWMPTETFARLLAEDGEFGFVTDR